MIIQRINQSTAEICYVNTYNSTTTYLSTGYLVSFNVRNLASANGIDIEQPTTSGAPALAGVVYGNGAGITSNAYGLVQTYGFCNAYVSCSGGETAAPGQVMGAVTGQYYASSNGTSNNLGPIIVMSQRVGLNALNPVFVRAL
ncbi:MAG: hypothetical protein KGJ89_05030 [Patescibacteria group bacterium]|nr:hypothetical protein [Patescibacteria group bacterium]MDE2227285.1 hypothetical protein [Patescibacteria group bacterium]